jgi:hypothetical protein
MIFSGRRLRRDFHMLCNAGASMIGIRPCAGAAFAHDFEEETKVAFDGLWALTKHWLTSLEA